MASPGGISVTVIGSTVHVITPYDPAFPPRARRLGGRWDGISKAWKFNLRDFTAVRILVNDIYGTEGAGQIVAAS